MNKYKTVPDFLADLDDSMLKQVNLLRKIIKEGNPLLVENIKWNAPNFVFDNDDRLTLNLMNKEGKLKLILHMGASKKEDKKARPILKDDSGIVEWNSDIRGLITFENEDDIQSKREQLAVIIQNWLAL